jgi:hypothetical protein
MHVGDGTERRFADGTGGNRHGRPVADPACMTLAVMQAGRSIVTAEGLGAADHLHPVQTASQEDFSALYRNGPLQWEDVYNAALRYYFLLFPAMSTFIQLDDEASIVSHTDVIRQRLNTPVKPALFTTYNMPPRERCRRPR